MRISDWSSDVCSSDLYDVNSGASSINTIISEDCDGMRLDRALAMLMPDLSRERLKALILDGKVIRQGTTAIAAPSYQVSEGQPFKITVPPPIEAQADRKRTRLTYSH